jgi:hypothetical protein
MRSSPASSPRRPAGGQRVRATPRTLALPPAPTADTTGEHPARLSAAARRSGVEHRDGAAGAGASSRTQRSTHGRPEKRRTDSEAECRQTASQPEIRSARVERLAGKVRSTSPTRSTSRRASRTETTAPHPSRRRAPPPRSWWRACPSRRAFQPSPRLAPPHRLWAAARWQPRDINTPTTVVGGTDPFYRRGRTELPSIWSRKTCRAGWWLT